MEQLCSAWVLPFVALSSVSSPLEKLSPMITLTYGTVWYLLARKRELLVSKMLPLTIIISFNDAKMIFRPKSKLFLLLNYYSIYYILNTESLNNWKIPERKLLLNLIVT